MTKISVLVGILLLFLVCAVATILLVAVAVFLVVRARNGQKRVPTADHFAFQVADLNRAIAFYTERLGLKLMSVNIDEDHHEAFAFVELQGGNLELLQVLDEDNKPVPMEPKEASSPFCPHLAIAIDDMNELVRTVRNKDIPILRGPLEIPGKVRWIYVADPDNNVIEFVHWL